MSYLQVDPQILAATGARLRDAVAVTTEVARGSAAMSVLVDDAGSGELTAAVREFLTRWKHGLGCLTEDAGTLAAMLVDSGRVYIEVETSVARAAQPGGAA